MRKKSSASLPRSRGTALPKALACLSLAACLASCGPGSARETRRPSPPPSAKASAPEAAARTAGQPRAASLPGAEPSRPLPSDPSNPPKPPSPPEKTKPLPPPSIAQPRAFGLASVAGPILPEDFAIGPLQDRRPPRLDEKAAADAAAAFLGALLEGKLAEARVLPERLGLLGALLAPLLGEEKPVSYRLGAIDFSEGTGSGAFAAGGAAAGGGADGREASAVASVALFGAAGFAERRAAEIGLRREGADWYVESFAAAAPGSGGAAGEAYEPRLRRP